MHYGEVTYRQGTWVTRHDHESQAILWCIGRQVADRQSVNPVQEMRVRPVPEPAPLRPVGEGECPACGDPVAASVGVHFDCRDA